MAYRKRKSCRSHGERELKEIFDELNVRYMKEVKFDKCKSPKGKHLRFDFFLPDYNLLIEYQGVHHYKPINKYYRAQIVHRKTVEHDKLKIQFCDKHNIPLLQIPYWEREKIREIVLGRIGELYGSKDLPLNT